MYRFFLIGVCTTALTTPRASAMILDGWSGLISDEAPARLAHQIEEEVLSSTFVAGIINDAERYAAFAEAAGHAFPTDPELDWDEQLVAYVILEEHTNRLRLESWLPPVAGRALLNFRWDLIEPYYQDAFPALFHAVSRSQLASIDLVILRDFADDIELGTLGIPLLGDANNDGQVTGRDLAAVQSHFGAKGSTSGMLPGDADDNGYVSGGDLVSVQQHYGDALIAGGSSVPEPTATMALILLCWLTSVRRD